MAAWFTRTNWTTGQTVSAADLNAPGLDVRTWGGNVDAGGNDLLNVGGISGVSGALGITGSINASTKGSIFGTAAGLHTAPATADANVMLYNFGGGNWAGMGADSGGNMWFRTGISGTPDASVVITAAGVFTVLGKTQLTLSTFASDAAAGTAGLTAGMLWQDSSGNVHAKL